MGLAGLTDWGPTAALEAMARFAGERQRLISHNIANISTPGFLHVDLSPAAFQRKLGEAIDEKRESRDSKPLTLDSGGESEVGPDGNVWAIDWYNYIVQHNRTQCGRWNLGTWNPRRNSN